MKQDGKKSLTQARWIRLSKFYVCVTGLLLFSAYFLTSCGSSVEEKKPAESPFRPLPENLVSTDEMEDVDFSRFEHDSERHRNLPCLLCHQQKDSSSRPQFASHAVCTGCHTPQFKDNTHPICSTCHVGSDSAELKAFPAMKSFRANFNHSQHIRTTDCATCHKPQGDGMTVPSGGDAHSNCLSCHTADKIIGDRNIGSCSTCHELGAPNRIVDSTAPIGFKFDHGNHSRVSCDSCHAPAGGNKMSEIAVAMHKGLPNSCATCHNSKRAFGANQMSDCRRCHTDIPASSNFGVRFSHAVHAKNDCATCHQGGAVNFSVPNGAAAHTSCYQCHAPGKSAAAQTACFTCHKIGGGGTDIKPSRAVIPGNFAHSKHEFLGCDSCHSQNGAKMTMPFATMHKAKGNGTNCATCHDNQTAFGEDFASCKRCHVGGKFDR